MELPACTADAVDHVARICRILSTERGSAMLVGVGGSGKQSLAKLAAYIAGSKVFQIAVSKGYGVASFLEDIKVGFTGYSLALNMKWKTSRWVWGCGPCNNNAWNRPRWGLGMRP
jgi:hypothetical protein